jgi:hypothetical protein
MIAKTNPRAKWAPGPAGWMLICFLLPTLFYIWAVREPPPRWRAAYFANERLERVALVREERDVNHDWNRRGPPEGVPADRFGVRWDSCLDLERAQVVAFQLTTQGDARLLIGVVEDG